jgi:hypothetical protein
LDDSKDVAFVHPRFQRLDAQDRHAIATVRGSVDRVVVVVVVAVAAADARSPNPAHRHRSRKHVRKEGIRHSHLNRTA